MQWIVIHGLKLYLVVIYIRYSSAVDSLQWDVELTSELDYEKANTPIGPSGYRSELIFYVDTIYKGQIGSRFTFVREGILLIM